MNHGGRKALSTTSLGRFSGKVKPAPTQQEGVMAKCYCKECGEYMGEAEVETGTCRTCDDKATAELIRKYNLKVVDMVMDAVNLSRRES